MVSKSSLARMKADAYEVLHEQTHAIASALNIAPPDLNIHQRYNLEYRQVVELERIGNWLAEIAPLLSAGSDSRYDAVAKLVSNSKWTKPELEALVLGGGDGD